MKKLFSFALCFVFLGCATAPALTPQQTAYFEKAKAFPATFTLPNSDAEAAWGRAQSFVAQHSNMKIQTVSQYIIQTYTPTGSWPKYGYNISRTPTGDKTQFTVQCICSNMFNKKEERQNASILAYYMATGELDPRFVYR